MKVGLIGLGNMGSGMAASLLKGGHEVTVYNRTPTKAQALVALGARHVARVADACRGDAVITMLADDSAVESVVFGDASVIKNLAKGAIHISSSTISVALSEKMAAAHAASGQRFVSAPVFGRPEAAAAARLFIAVAGAPDAVDDCMPLFDSIGQKTFHFGENPPDANLVKLSGNFLISSVIEALGEAMALVGKAGLDQHQYVDFLTSTLFNAPVYKTYGGLIADKKFVPAGFAAPLGFKDNRLVLAAAEKLRVPLPLASLIYNRFLTLLARGGESLDWSAFSQLAAEDAGQAALPTRK
ncbi:MAG: NAD(P)-dependent oxidoreductase [Acidobacteriia bacterium]|nr:NAD(P)-dependent oxidoreductase [Terriglobia bacterium]